MLTNKYHHDTSPVDNFDYIMIFVLYFKYSDWCLNIKMYVAYLWNVYAKCVFEIIDFSLFWEILLVTSTAQRSWKKLIKQTPELFSVKVKQQRAINKLEGQTACRSWFLTSEVFRLPLLLRVLMDSWREEMAALQLLANGSIFCETARESDIVRILALANVKKKGNLLTT